MAVSDGQAPTSSSSAPFFVVVVVVVGFGLHCANGCCVVRVCVNDGGRREYTWGVVERCHAGTLGAMLQRGFAQHVYLTPGTSMYPSMYS